MFVNNKTYILFPLERHSLPHIMLLLMVFLSFGHSNIWLVYQKTTNNALIKLEANDNLVAFVWAAMKLHIELKWEMNEK